jgi:hypothetical protein
MLGGGCPLCPSNSDVDLLGNFEGVIDFDAEVPDSAFNLGVSKQQLHRSQVASALVDHAGLGSPQ